MNTKITQEMIDYCRGLGNGEIEPEYEERGLCGNFVIEFSHSLGDLNINFLNYPERSGLRLYPIKHPEMAADFAFSSIRKLWDPTTEYGRNRLHFCRWVADELERKKKSQEEAERYHYETLQQESRL